MSEETQRQLARRVGKLCREHKVKYTNAATFPNTVNAAIKRNLRTSNGMLYHLPRDFQTLQAQVEFYHAVMQIIEPERTHYICWYERPVATEDDPLIIGMKYLKYTKGALIPMSLLLPDRSKTNRDDFIWCLPIERVKWNKWYALAEKFKTVTPDGVRYINRVEGKQVRTIIVMPNSQQTDDDAETACAWLRMVKQQSCRMYVMRCADDRPRTMAEMINATAGVDVNYVEELEDAPEEEAGPK